MKICILGSHDMAAGSRGGTVYMAETLAALGHAVTYVPSQVSTLGWLAPRARRRTAGVRTVHHGIAQVTPRTFAPWRVAAMADRIGCGAAVFSMNRLVERLASTLPDTRFDLCVASAAGTLTVVDRIRADRYVYRRNDLLGGLSGVPRALCDFELRILESGRFSLASCVNHHVAADIEKSIPSLRTNVVPNGIALDLYDTAEPDRELLMNRDHNVLFVGGVTHWVDVPLILETARRLPAYTFHVYGPWHVPEPADPLPPNVRIYGPINHVDAVSKMKACAVGIIPSGVGNEGRMVVKPIKYYEYLAAGMGVAATTRAGEGLERFAAVGDGADGFAAAILDAPVYAQRNRMVIDAEVREMGWSSLVPRMLEI